MAVTSFAAFLWRTSLLPTAHTRRRTPNGEFVFLFFFRHPRAGADDGPGGPAKPNVHQRPAPTLRPVLRPGALSDRPRAGTGGL